MKTMTALQHAGVATAAIVLTYSPAFAGDLVQGQPRQNAAVEQHFNASVFPGFDKDSTNAFMSHFSTRVQEPPPFANELDRKPDDLGVPGFDRLGSSGQPVGNLLRLEF